MRKGVRMYDVVQQAKSESSPVPTDEECRAAWDKALKDAWEASDDPTESTEPAESTAATASTEPSKSTASMAPTASKAQPEPDLEEPEWWLEGEEVEFDHYRGLASRQNEMISLYIPGIYNYLILPRQLRSIERGLFMPKDSTKSLIRIHGRDDINSMSNLITPKIIKQNLPLKLDITKILEGHLGVQVVWQPFDIPEPEDANKLFADLVEAGLCFVPVVGPLASTCFTLFIDIVNNSEAFKEKDPFDLGGSLLENTASSAEAIADGLPKYSKAGKIAGFLGKIGGALTKLATD